MTETAHPIRVALADDAVLLREGVASLLGSAGFDVVAQAKDAEQLLEAVAMGDVDVCVVDIRMPPSHSDEGLRAALRIRDEHPGIGMLVLSQYLETSYAMRLFAGGADGEGHLLKDRVADVEAFTEAARREAHVRSIFTKLGLEPAPDDHRRVLAGLTYLRS